MVLYQKAALLPGFPCRNPASVRGRNGTLSKGCITTVAAMLSAQAVAVAMVLYQKAALLPCDYSCNCVP
jgi:hypothetical protein